MAESSTQIHEFEPVYNKESEVLILGTFPSVKSREQGFFYGHPQNRFWKVIAGLIGSPVPVSIEEKKTLLLQNKIAVWDVIAQCDIAGSSDSSIKNVIPANIESVVRGSKIERIYANGNTAKKLYDKYILPELSMEITGLPSTSPANAGYSLERLLEAWKVILPLHL